VEKGSTVSAGGSFMLKRDQDYNANDNNALAERIHKIKIFLIDFTLLILLVAFLLQILLHEAVPVFSEFWHKFSWL
jgi:hypothetical protein